MLTSFHSLLCSRIVTIIVGPEKVRFLAHQAIFDQPDAGGFFQKVFINGFQETAEGVLMLPDDDANLVGRFIEKLYVSKGSTRERKFFLASQNVLHTDIYSFGHKYCIHDIENRMISAMFSHCMRDSLLHSKGNLDGVIDTDALHRFVKAVPEGSHMHTLLAKWIAKDMLLSADLKPGNWYPDYDDVPEVLLKLAWKHGRAAALAWRNGELDKFMGADCDYYVYDSPEPRKDDYLLLEGDGEYLATAGSTDSEEESQG